MLALYGDLTFTNRQGRDRARTALTDEAAARGFTTPTVPYSGYTGGTQTVGTTGLRFLFTHTDEAVANQAQEDLDRVLASNGRADGLFSLDNVG